MMQPHETRNDVEDRTASRIAILAAENAALKALVAEMVEAMRDLADEARSACEAIRFPSLTEALSEADALIARAKEAL